MNTYQLTQNFDGCFLVLFTGSFSDCYDRLYSEISRGAREEDLFVNEVE